MLGSSILRSFKKFQPKCDIPVDLSVVPEMLVMPGSVLVIKSLTLIFSNLVKKHTKMNKQIISDGVKCCEENNSKSMRHILSGGIAFSRMMIRKDVCE